MVYTRENETGDMYIESLVRGIGKHDRVWVATSDSLIQLSAFRAGVLRLSARELKAEVDSACGEMTALLQAMDRAQTVARQQEKRGQIPEKLLRLLPELCALHGKSCLKGFPGSARERLWGSCVSCIKPEKPQSSIAMVCWQ